MNCLDKDITYLNLNQNISMVLKNNNIHNVNDLWLTNRKSLKEIGLRDNQIKEIIIKLELNGLDLNKRITK